MKTKKIAFCGLFSAVSLVILLLSSVFSTLKLTSSALAGAILCMVVLIYGRRAAFLSYGVVSVLGLLLLPNKDAAVFFVAFFGYYPILKSVFEGLKNLRKEYACKLVSFNAALLLLFFVFKNMLLLPDISNIFLVIAGFFALNGVFLAYDKALSGVIFYFENFLERFLK